MSGRLTRFGVAAFLLFSIAAPALAQSTHAEWLALRTRKQARHHRLSGPATQPDAFTMTSIRFFSDASGQLVGVGEARNDTVFDLSYSRLNFTFLDAAGSELGREWTYLHGGVNARITANNASETLLVPGATGFFKIWTTIPASSMVSYTAASAGETLAYAKPQASLGLPDTRPEIWVPLVYVSGRFSRFTGPHIFGFVLNDDPLDPNCPCGHRSVFTSSVQVSVAAYHQGVITDVQSVTAVGPRGIARCTDPVTTGMALHQTATYAIDLTRPADSIGRHSVDWQETERPGVVSASFPLFERFGGQESFIVDPLCGSGAPVVSAPWLSVVDVSPNGPTSGRVTFTVDANTSSLMRFGFVTVSGMRVNVSQLAACPVYPSQTLFLSGGRVTDLRPVDVARPGCPDATPSSNVDWLQAATAGGGLKLRVWAEPNFTGATRTGVITLGPRTITIHQNPLSRGFDVNNDGGLDLMWYHRGGGWVAAWRMDGLRFVDGTLLSWNRVVDLNWTAATVTDLDANGRADLVWQNQTTRDLAVWPLAGTNVVRGDTLAAWASSPQFKVRASGDFNRDGAPDLVLQHEITGQIEVVYVRAGLEPHLEVGEAAQPPALQGRALLGPGIVGDANWRIAGSGDFHNDGWPDLVWQHQTDGRIAVWMMHGTTLVAGIPISPAQVPDLDWRIRAVGDINGDDMPDLIWQHRLDGRVAAWLMNGTRMVSATVFAQVPDTGWEIVGPR